MQYGLLKYDEWDDLIWLYNSIDSSIRTSLTGALIGINREDESIKYTHFIGQDRDPYRIADSYNAYCGCFDSSIFSIAVYPDNLLVAKPNDLFVVSKDGDRCFNVLNSASQYELTSAGTSHICCGIFPSTPNNSRIIISNNSNDLFYVDAYTGQVQSKLSPAIDLPNLNFKNDKISCISDFMSNQCTTSCPLSYHLEGSLEQTADHLTHSLPDSSYTYNPQLTHASEPAFAQPNVAEDFGKRPTSFQSIAEKYGSIDSIPEFVPSSYSLTQPAPTLTNYGSTATLHSYGTLGPADGAFPGRQPSHPSDMGMLNTTYIDRSVGSMSLECSLKELKRTNSLQNEFVDTTCVGMTSGFLHVVDNRTNKVASSIKCSNNPVYSISAAHNTIATTSCTLYHANSYGCQYNPYSYANNYTLMRLFEPVVYIHDIRMMKSRTIMLPKPVNKLCIVPRSDRLFALSQDGDLFDCKVSTLDYVRQPATPTVGVQYHDLDVCLRSRGDSLDLFTSDSTYSVHTLRLSNKLSRYLDYSTTKLPWHLKRILKSESKNYNNTPFASLVGTYDGDVAHMFVQMFFFLPKIPSIKYHICENSHCITCQVGFALHKLQVHYENSLEVQPDGLTKFSKDTHTRKYSNNIMYVTQLQQLMLVESDQNLRTPLNLLLWVIEKLNTEMYNYYSKNNLNVTTDLIKDLFSYSKRVTTRCNDYGHVNTKLTNNNFYVNYELVQINNGSATSRSSSTPAGNTSRGSTGRSDASDLSSTKSHSEYCRECNRIVESSLAVEFINTPNVLIVDFSTSKVDRIDQHLTLNGVNYNLMSFFFTFPPDNMYYRSMAYIKLPPKYKNTEHEWLLINDGIVMYVNEGDDIFDFTKNWKILVFALYVLDSLSTARAYVRNPHTPRHPRPPKDQPTPPVSSRELDSIREIVPCYDQKENITSVKGRLVPLPYPTVKAPVPSYIFLSEHNIAHNPLAHNKIQTFTPITLDELKIVQNASFIMALDIEYVKSDLKNTSTFHNTAPSNMIHNRSSFIVSEDDDKYMYTLARVSAIRGNDMNYGVPFLDHYILNNKPPKDYMTRFSGIHSGDLELKSSVHWLTTEKMIYLKLRYLIDHGCKVIGHGLEQDFRILNICVPKENIIDTVELFWIPGKRYLSLQFLAYYLLNRKIQQQEHDSVEDAKTALQLYKLYINYKLNKKLKVVIDKLYEIGYQTNWTLKIQSDS